MTGKLEKEIWFEEIIAKSDNLHYLGFIRRNIGMLEVPSNRLPYLLRKLDYKIRTIHLRKVGKELEREYK